MRAWILAVAISACAASTARADYPAREIDRPLVLAPGLTEIAVSGDYARAARAFDDTGRARELPPGGIESAVTSALSARYGVFAGLEVWAVAPYVVHLGLREDDRALSGTGRAAFGGRYELSPRPLSFVAASGGIVLPSTARRLRTDPDGTLHRDHLAVAGAVQGKQTLMDQTAVFGSAEILFPFANEDDDEAERDPPATFRLATGSIFQVDARFHAELGASFTRTNRDRVSGALVPDSDQRRVELLPAVGWTPIPPMDVRVAAAIPVAGKNTPQSFVATATMRVRF